MLTIDDIDKVGVLVFDTHLKVKVPVVKKAESVITPENIHKMEQEMNDIIKENLNLIFKQEHGIQNMVTDIACDVMYVQN